MGEEREKRDFKEEERRLAVGELSREKKKGKEKEKKRKMI